MTSGLCRLQVRCTPPPPSYWGTPGVWDASVLGALDSTVVGLTSQILLQPELSPPASPALVRRHKGPGLGSGAWSHRLGGLSGVVQMELGWNRVG